MPKSPEFYAFSFRPDFPNAAALGILPQLQMPVTLRLRLSLSAEEIYMLEQLMDCCLREFPQQINGWETAVKGMLQTMLVLFSRAYADQCKISDDQSAIMESIRYIDNHFREDIRLQEILERFHFSASGFYRTFHKMTGKNLPQYLVQKRIEYAISLLRNTNLPLQIVADRCGYKDYSTFYRAFQKQTGLKPSRYPRSKRQDTSM